MSGSGDAVRFLLARDCSSLEAKDHDGRTALHLASGHRLGSDSTLVALVESGANMEATTSLGETPLHKACKALRVTAVQQLLRFGANQAAVDAGGRTPAALTAQLFQSQCPGMFRDMLQRILGLLAMAPADRAWRRRGWLLMLRSRRQDDGNVRNRWLIAGGHQRRTLGVRCINSGGGIATETIRNGVVVSWREREEAVTARPWKVWKTRHAGALALTATTATTSARDSGHGSRCRERMVGALPSSYGDFGRGLDAESGFLGGGDGGNRALRSVVQRAVGFHEDGLFRNIVAFL